MFKTLKRLLIGTAAVSVAAPILGPVAAPMVAGMVLTPVLVDHHHRRGLRAPDAASPVIGQGTATGPVTVGRLHRYV